MSTATIEAPVESLEEQFKDAIPCNCIKKDSPCEDPAVAFMLLSYSCAACSPYLPALNHWFMVCERHRKSAYDGRLKCSWCQTPGAWTIIEERPL